MELSTSRKDSVGGQQSLDSAFIKKKNVQTECSIVISSYTKGLELCSCLLLTPNWKGESQVQGAELRSQISGWGKMMGGSTRLE